MALDSDAGTTESVLNECEHKWELARRRMFAEPHARLCAKCGKYERLKDEADPTTAGKPEASSGKPPT